MEQVAYHYLERVYPRGNLDRICDLDYYQVSLKPDAPGVEELLHRLCGSQITLAANLPDQDRGWKPPQGTVYLLMNPIIMVTSIRPDLKAEICQDVSRMGYPAVPTADQSRYLCYGRRPVPLSVLLRSVRNRCDGIMLVSYGMKVPLSGSPIAEAQQLIRDHHPEVK